MLGFDRNIWVTQQPFSGFVLSLKMSFASKYYLIKNHRHETALIVVDLSSIRYHRL